VQASFTPNPQEAFWTFSNFRDKVDARGPTAVAAVKTAAQRIEQDAVALQKPLEKTALQLYRSDKVAALRLLENYSKGIYLSCLEAMNTVLSQE
jgi:hypothetical protein